MQREREVQLAAMNAVRYFQPASSQPNPGALRLPGGYETTASNSTPDRLRKFAYLTLSTPPMHGPTESETGKKLRLLNLAAISPVGDADCYVSASGNRDSWEKVGMLLDSGAKGSVASVENHGKYMNKWEALVGPVALKLLNGAKIEVVCVGVTFVKAVNKKGETTEFGPVRFFMVRDNNWNELVLGRGPLEKHGLLPAQNLGKNKTTSRN